MSILFRNGRGILRTSKNPDGSVVLEKTATVKAEHIYRITGAPGWDKEHVDATFPPGQAGKLRYTSGAATYDIDIATFREHAFEKEVEPHGLQYHVNIKHWTMTGVKTSAKRETAALPDKLSFGEWVPCSSCKASPGKAKSCAYCEGRGYVRWSPGESR